MAKRVLVSIVTITFTNSVQVIIMFGEQDKYYPDCTVDGYKASFEYKDSKFEPTETDLKYAEKQAREMVKFFAPKAKITVRRSFHDLRKNVVATEETEETEETGDIELRQANIRYLQEY